MPLLEKVFGNYLVWEEIVGYLDIETQVALLYTCKYTHSIIHERRLPRWLMDREKSQICNLCGNNEQDRCEGCGIRRTCQLCRDYYCSDCDPDLMEISRDCYECGQACSACKENVIMKCRSCNGRYCRIHQESSTDTYCDWCFAKGRRVFISDTDYE